MADQEILKMVASLRDDASAVLKRLEQNMEGTAKGGGVKGLRDAFSSISGSMNPLIVNMRDGLLPTLNTLGITSLTTAGVVGGLFYGMQRLSQGSIGMKHLSDTTRIATSDISRLRRAGEELGATSDEMDTAISKFGRTMLEMRGGVAGEPVGGARDLLDLMGRQGGRALGIWTAVRDQLIKTPGNTLAAMTVFFEKVKELPPDKAAVLLEQWGFPKQITPELLEIFNRIPVTLSFDVELAKKFNQEWVEMNRQSDEFAKRVFLVIGPHLTEMIKQMNDLFAGRGAYEGDSGWTRFLKGAQLLTEALLPTSYLAKMLRDEGPVWVKDFQDALKKWLEGDSDWLKAFTRWFLYGPSGNAPLFGGGSGSGGGATGEPGGPGADVPMPRGLPSTPRPRGGGRTFEELWRERVAPQGSPPAGGPGRDLAPSPGGVDRSGFLNEIENNPGLITRMASMVKGEVGLGPRGDVDEQTVQLETAFNRAQARGHSLREALLSVGESRKGYYATDTYRRPATSQETEWFTKNILGPVLAGSDKSTERLGFMATGNASQLGFAERRYRQGYYAARKWWSGVPGKGEMFALERADRDRVGRIPRLPDTGMIDRSLWYGSGMMGRVEGSADINVNVNAPRGTSVDASSSGIFKSTTINRAQQMGIANESADGPSSYDEKWGGF